MLNETLNNSIGLTYDSATNVTNSIPMIIALAIVWFLPLLIYFIWGALASSRTADGRKLNSKVISNANFWIGFLIFGLIQLSLFLILVIFPVWILPFE